MYTYGVVLVLVSSIISPIFAQQNETFPGPCPSIGDAMRIEEAKFAGKWYEIKRFQNSLISGHCSLPNYIENKNDGFNVSYLTTNLQDKKNSTNEILLRKVKIGGFPGNYDMYVNDKKEPIGQKILETDYETYSIVYGCTYNSTNGTNTQRLSIYSRKNTLNSTIIDKVMATLKTKGIKNETLIDVVQDNKQCGRNTATTVLLPTILSSIIVLLVTQQL